MIKTLGLLVKFNHTVLKASPGAAIFGRDMLFTMLLKKVVYGLARIFGCRIIIEDIHKKCL